MVPFVCFGFRRMFDPVDGRCLCMEAYSSQRAWGQSRLEVQRLFSGFLKVPQRSFQNRVEDSKVPF